MRSKRLLALFALVALPLGGSAAMAAPAGADVAKAASMGAKSQIIDVRKGGGFKGGGFKGFKGGGFKGGKAFRGGGFKGGKAFRGGGPRFAYRGGKHFRGGPGKHWKPSRIYRHHRIRPYWYGVPYYYYGGYYPDYYDYDDYDDAVVYADDGDAVARCAARYRSFDPATGTYLNNDGRRYLCPYLR